MKLEGNSPKMQFLVFVIINNFRLSSFILLNHFPYSRQNSPSRDQLKQGKTVSDGVTFVKEELGIHCV